VNNSKFLICKYPSTPLLAASIGFVFTLHVLCREITLIIGEVDAVVTHNFSIELCFYLFSKIHYGISIQKTRLCWVMAVQIQVEKQSILWVVIVKKFSYCVYSWMLLEVILVIIAIKVLVVYVHTVVSVIDSIRVNHWHNFEHEEISQHCCPFILSNSCYLCCTKFTYLEGI